MSRSISPSDSSLSGRSAACPFRVLSVTTLLLSSVVLLTACSDDDDDNDRNPRGSSQLFPQDGMLTASIRRTTNGVPHVQADNLASAAFGAGFAQAQDNVCILADGFVQARSERALYFGPGPDDTNINVINDFSYKAQNIREGADAEFKQLSAQSRALVEGFTAGYNAYVEQTDPATLPPACRSQPWVKPITPVDLYAHYRIVGQYASGDLFSTGAVFSAVPPGVSVLPTPVPASEDQAASGEVEQRAAATGLIAGIDESAVLLAAARKDYTDTGLASNAWGIGRDMSEQGRGALLANPHFPYTGARRLYQVQMTVPGFVNMNGAGLSGTAIPLINFNQNLGWSHTVTTSRRFTIYALSLKPGDPMIYIKDGEEKPITSKTFTIQVNNGTAVPTTLEKTMYFSEYGPMLAANLVTKDDKGNEGLPAWGKFGLAYTYRDANALTTQLLDTWLDMSRAKNLEEFKQVFKECGSTFWTNTTYADDQGNAYYIDSSSVPNLSDETIAVINQKRASSPTYAKLFDAGLTILDGSSSRDDWVEGDCNGLVPFDKKPKLLRSDFVQNSNSSFWATNPAELLTGYSPMFGPEAAPLNPRTRLGLKMLQNPLDPGFALTPPAGQDGKFSAEDLIGVIYNNRAFFSEQLKPELLERCALIEDTPVITAAATTEATAQSRSVAAGCAALVGWDGLYDLDSTGAHVFRVFMASYIANLPKDYSVPFDPADPVATPSTPKADGRGTPDDLMLQALAKGLDKLTAGGIAYDARLDTVQYYQASGGVPPGGVAMDLGQRIPWHGGDGNIDGAFNAIGVVDSTVEEDTRLPRVPPSLIEDTAGLADDGTGWHMARGTSWHFGLEFTDSGPEAYGLVSYSQSTDPGSEFFNDQSLRYSAKNYRRLLFTEEDIVANLIPDGESQVSVALPPAL